MFRLALMDATAFQAQNPDATRAIIAKYTKLPPQAQAGILLLPLQPNISAADLKHYADEMVDLGILKASPDLAEMIGP